jgi:Ca-activated chloride channel family protein
MRFAPLMAWWIVVPFLILGLAAIGWEGYKSRGEGVRAVLAWVRRAVTLLLLVAIVLGPSVPGGTSSPGVANLDVLFAVDTTASMGANDYADSKLRLDGAKQDLLALAATLEGAHLGLITFDSKANTILPFTADSGTFTSAVQTLNREVAGTSKGSVIDKPIDLITQQLKNSKAAHPERSRLLFYLGDGEQTIDTKVKSFEPISQYVNGGAVLGYGTDEGSKILKYSGLGDSSTASSTNPTYVNTPDPQTKKFVPAISKLDEKALKEIASQLKVTYINRNSGGPAEAVYKESKAQVLIDQGRKITHYINLYWTLAIPFAGLLFWEWKNMLFLVIELRKNQGKKHD